MALGTTTLTVAGVAVAGVVGYKIIKKKHPELITKTRETLKDIQDGMCDLCKGAKESFSEGFSNA